LKKGITKEEIEKKELQRRRLKKELQRRRLKKRNYKEGD